MSSISGTGCPEGGWQGRNKEINIQGVNNETVPIEPKSIYFHMPDRSDSRNDFVLCEKS